MPFCTYFMLVPCGDPIPLSEFKSEWSLLRWRMVHYELMDTPCMSMFDGSIVWVKKWKRIG